MQFLVGICHRRNRLWTAVSRPEDACADADHQLEDAFHAGVLAAPWLIGRQQGDMYQDTEQVLVVIACQLEVFVLSCETVMLYWLVGC